LVDTNKSFLYIVVITLKRSAYVLLLWTKKQLAQHYPEPKCETIVEPFAGAALGKHNFGATPPKIQMTKTVTYKTSII
jgi:hypothetical protein